MKKLLLLLVFGIFSLTAFSQSGFRTQSAEGIPPAGGVSASQISLHNAWIGSSFSYQLTGQDTLADNFLFDINLLYDLQFGNWHFPIAGEFSLPIGGGDLSNIEVGIYPWSIVAESNTGGVLVAHGGISYSTLPASDSDGDNQSIRVLAGVEFSQPIGNSNLPLTASITPVFESNNVIANVENLFSLEVTAIIPIAPNLGVLAEVITPFDSGVKTTFNAGIVVNGAIGG